MNFGGGSVGMAVTMNLLDLKLEIQKVHKLLGWGRCNAMHRQGKK